jgi:hypothetical protein
MSTGHTRRGRGGAVASAGLGGAGGGANSVWWRRRHEGCVTTHARGVVLGVISWLEPQVKWCDMTWCSRDGSYSHST